MAIESRGGHNLNEYVGTTSLRYVRGAQTMVAQALDTCVNSVEHRVFGSSIALLSSKPIF